MIDEEGVDRLKPISATMTKTFAGGAISVTIDKTESVLGGSRKQPSEAEETVNGPRQSYGVVVPSVV